MSQPGIGEGRSPGVAEIGAMKPKVQDVKAPPVITPVQKEQIQVIEDRKENGVVSDPDAALRELAEEPAKSLPGETDILQQVKESQQESDVLPSEQRPPRELDGAKLAAGEKEYIAATLGKNKDLADFYADTRTDAAYVQKQVDNFASERGVHHETVDALTGKHFGAETRSVITETVQRQIDTLFNSAEGRMSPDKHKSVVDQTQRYLDLMEQAQKEGDMSATVDAQTVLRHVENNVWSLALQDRVASENMLGDHGVRHLVDHNIRAGEVLFDEIARNGQPVKAIDRLMLHQVMIDHDMGYAMDPVREPIAKGKFGADGGHNVLAAKYTRQRAEDSTSALGQVFTDQQLGVIHEGILSHDSRAVKISLTDTSDQSRIDNLTSIIHTADNTHAFEDKLPELLYGYPDSLKTMRLMKTAGEIGDQAMVDDLRQRLVVGIQGNDAFSADDREALVNAAGFIRPDSYKKSVPRICGNKPEFSITENGVIEVSVAESAIHQEVVGMFGQQQNEQLQKFIGDTTGIKNVDANTANEVSSPEGTITIKLRTGENRADTQTDYQERIDTLIDNPEFRAFVVQDAILGTDQAQKQKMHDEASEGSAEQASILADITTIREQRRSNLEQIMNPKTTPAEAEQGGTNSA